MEIDNNRLFRAEAASTNSQQAEGFAAVFRDLGPDFLGNLQLRTESVEVRRSYSGYVGNYVGRAGPTINFVV